MKMGLFADAIRFPEPRCDFIVDFADALEAKGMKMIARRESFDPAKARMFETPREDDMAIHPVLSNDERGKTHPHLKRNPCLLREHGDWPVSPRDAQ